MVIADGKLLLTDKDPNQGLSLPIDRFFRSLAKDQRERAIAVVLSGTGSDGSRGVREVHEAGGVVLVQKPETAKFDGMPRSALDSGVVDAALAPEEMPEAILKYLKRLGTPRVGEESNPPDGIAKILELLHTEYGIAFSHYKPGTIVRRIERRLLLNRSVDLDEYATRLAVDKAELHALYQDLLIGVTTFFRDPDAFYRLELEILPQIVARARADDEIRIWIAGCATGEEAYSLAMIVQECLEAAKKQHVVKIFATDVHRASLEIAAAGIYPEASLSEIDSRRRRRFFRQDKLGYHVIKSLRRMIVFAPHNVIKDAPFTKLDLIACRNLLIYLQPAVQKRVFSLFHFALKAGGYLFLGPSETPGDLADEFETVDRYWKIYRKQRDIRIPAELRPPSSLQPKPLRPLQSSVPKPPGVDPVLARAREALIGQYACPTLLELDGFDVRACADGESGLLEILKDPPDLVLVDIGLPKMDGYELAQRVREQLAEGPRLVALTGYGRPEDRRAVRRAGFDEHLVKPVTREMLRSLMQGS